MKKIYKKLLVLIIIVNFIGIIIEGATVSSITAAVNNSTEKDRLQIIKEKGILTVASANEPPFFYINAKTNMLTGIDADIIAEITRRLGINKIEMKEEIPFANLLDQLNTDDSIDIAANGIYITPKREEMVSFTEPLYKESEAVIVSKASKINFMDDLKNAVVGVERGTVFAELAQKRKENGSVKDIIIFEKITDLLSAINRGEADAGLADSAVISYFLLTDKNLFLRTLKDYKPELPGNIGLAVKKSDTDLLKALNEIINEMKADGTLYAILVNNGLGKSNMI